MRRSRPDNELLHNIHSYGLNHSTREIYLHASYYSFQDSEEDSGIECRMASQFVKNLHFLDGNSDKSNILVHLHTSGGNWSDGMAIFDAVLHARSPVTILVYAEAESMGGVLLQAAPIRVMMPDAYFMLHYGSIGIDSNSLAVTSFVEFNKISNNRMISIFANRAMGAPRFKGWKFEKVYNYLDRAVKERGDWYLTSDQAVEYGFADGILGSKGYDDYNRIRHKRRKRLQS